MNPLVVTGRFSKLIHLLLRDAHPLGGGHVLSNTSGQVGQSFKGFHTFTLAIRHTRRCR